jgi:catechol 2,3-dioxygenase
MTTQNRIGVAPPGFRLPDATHVGRVRLQVSDLGRSIAYYEKVLGLEVTARDGGRASLAAKDGRVLLELVERPGARPVPHRGLRGLYHFAVLMPDRKSLAKFVVHLSEIGERAGMSDHLVSEAVYLSDPDGLGIEVYADRPREAWKAVDGQMTMATSPLDVQDLVQAAAAETWDGAPAGTTMGHVHFYVGDIAEAERFYHQGLGLDKIVWNYPGALFMSAGGYHHHVGTNTWAAGAPAATEKDAKLLDWELVLPAADDVDAAARSVQAAGFTVDHSDGNTYASDQQGIRVRLVAA